MTTSARTVITSSIFLQKIFYRIKLIDQWQGRQERGGKRGSLPQAPIVGHYKCVTRGTKLILNMPWVPLALTSGETPCAIDRKWIVDLVHRLQEL